MKERKLMLESAQSKRQMTAKEEKRHKKKISKKMARIGLSADSIPTKNSSGGEVNKKSIIPPKPKKMMSLKTGKVTPCPPPETDPS
jgi:hypothetical protein